jgi:hypothetical protein
MRNQEYEETFPVNKSCVDSDLYYEKWSQNFQLKLVDVDDVKNILSTTINAVTLKEFLEKRFEPTKRQVNGLTYEWTHVDESVYITKRDNLMLIRQSRDNRYFRTGEIKCTIQFYLWMNRLCQCSDIIYATKYISKAMPAVREIVSKKHTQLYFFLRTSEYFSINTIFRVLYFCDL